MTKTTAAAARRDARRRPASRAMFEGLEQRRLMSGTLALTNPDGLPASNRLIFNVVQNPNTTTPNATHDISSLTLTNTNTTPLTIGSITLGGPFAFVNAPAGNYAGQVLAANQSITVQVQFTQATLPAHSQNETNYTTNPNGGAAITGSMVVNSSDTANPTTTVALAGYWQNQSENNSEPNLTTIVNSLAGYATTISNTYQVDLNESSDSRTLYGSEVVSDSWAAADPARPVSIQTLAEFHTQGNVVHTYWYDASTQSPHLLFTSLPGEGQTLLPHTNNSSTLADATFSPSGDFGFRVDNEYSSDAINTANGNAGGGGHHFRFYPLVDTNGAPVANSWIVAMDYAVLQTENYDFQDNVFVVTNMRPTNAPPAPTGLTVTAGATPTLSWTEAAYPALAGFDVYRKVGDATTFTLLTATPQAATTYTDATAPVGSQVTYEVTAVDGQSTLQSQPTTIVTQTPGATGTTPAGGPVTAADAFNAYAGQPTTLAVLANDVDAVAGLNPATVAVVTPSAAGATITLNPTTGTLTYTAPAGSAATDTFAYTVTDTAGHVSQATPVTVAVSNPTTASPTANTDYVNVLANGSVTVAVTANDDAVTSFNLAAVAVASQATHGTATANADGSVTYTPAQNYVGGDSFTYTAVDTNGRTSNPATVNVNAGVALNPSVKGGARTLTYTDASGTPVTITLNRGTAAVYFAGTGTTTAAPAKNGTLAVGGTGLAAANIVLSGTTAASTLNVVGARNGKVNLYNVNSSTPVGTINAKTAVLAGNLNVAGLNNLTLAGMTANGNGATTAVLGTGAGIKSTAVTFGTVTDASLVSGVPLRSLKVTSWRNTENGTIGVTAPAITTLTAAQQFAPSLNVTGNVTNATVAGSLGTGFWNVGGTANNVTVGSVGVAWGGNFGGLTNLRIKSGGMPDTLTVGTLGTATIAGPLTGTMTVGTAKTIRVAGDMSGATLAATSAGSAKTPSIGQLQVTGAVSNSSITTVGNAQTIQVGSLADSLVAVGSSATTLTAASAADVGTATLSTLRVTGRGTVFNGSAVIAHTIANATVGQVNAADTSGTEGLAAVTFGSVAIGVDGGAVRLNKAALTDATTVSTYLTGRKQTLGGFVLKFV